MKRITGIFVLSAVACLALALTLFSPAVYATKICIDPGHGGWDCGALTQCGGMWEKEINLHVAAEFHWHMLFDSWHYWDIYPTRTDDSFVLREDRAKFANSNNVDRFISIHCNAGGGDGTETYCHPQGSDSAFSLRDQVHACVMDYMGTSDHECRMADFEVLRKTTMPAVLVELAYMDTYWGNCEKLQEPEYWDKAGQALVEALHVHYRTTTGFCMHGQRVIAGPQCDTLSWYNDCHVGMYDIYRSDHCWGPFQRIAHFSANDTNYIDGFRHYRSGLSPEIGISFLQLI